jgi:hypothetical protein
LRSDLTGARCVTLAGREPMRLDCGHTSETGFLKANGELVCFFCKVLRTAGATPRPRRSHEEAVVSREAKARAVAARREFHARRRMERETKKAVTQ